MFSGFYSVFQLCCMIMYHSKCMKCVLQIKEYWNLEKNAAPTPYVCDMLQPKIHEGSFSSHPVSCCYGQQMTVLRECPRHLFSKN